MAEGGSCEGLGSKPPGHAFEPRQPADGAQGGQGGPAGHQPAGKPRKLGGIDRIDALDDFFGGQWAAVGENLARQLFGAIAGNRQAMDGFVKMNAGTISPAEFLSPANIGAIMGT